MSKSGVPFRSMVVTGGFRQKTQLENLQQGVDVVIATPGAFMYMVKEGFLKLTNLRWYEQWLAYWIIYSFLTLVEMVMQPALEL